MEPKRRVQPGSHSNPAPAPLQNRLSGEPLWLSFPSPTLPFYFPSFHPLLFLCTVARGVVIFGRFSVLCALLCVLIVGHPSGGVMRRTCLRAAVPGCAVGLSMELQTPGPPEGQEEGGLGFVSAFLLLPSLRFSLRPLSYFHTLSLFFVCAILEPGEKQLLLQPVRRLPTFPARPCPINHGGAPATPWFCRSKLHEWRTFSRILLW